MAQKKKSTKKGASGRQKKNVRPVRREVAAVIFLFFGIFAALGYFSSEGQFIHFFCGLMKGLVGAGFYILPPALIFCAAILGFHKGKPVMARVICMLLVPILVGALAQLISGKVIYTLKWTMFPQAWKDGENLLSAGAVGGALVTLCSYLFNKIGAAIVLACGLVICLFVAFRISVSEIAGKVRDRERPEYREEDYLPEKNAKPARTGKASAYMPQVHQVRKSEIDIPLDGGNAASAEETVQTPQKPSLFNRKPRVATPEEFVTGKAVPESESPVEEKQEIPVEVLPRVSVPAAPKEESVIAREISSEKLGETAAKQPVPAKPKTAETAPVKDEYRFPPVDLLKVFSGVRADSREETRVNRERLEASLNSFGINSTISNIIRGPSVTRYEMELEAGVKLNKITNLADDIALSLGCSGVRIAAIPDKVSTVGIEVPNKVISTVYLRDIIDTPVFSSAKSKLTFAIGKDISGNAIVGNISKLPHLLVAGTTGSGKSVCLNSMILSILYKAKPDEVKFILVDPKMVEFRIYNGIPHLLVPVVTEAKKASGALQWAVVEMMKRYRLFSESNARDLPAYNKLVAATGEAEPLPQIVVVIDELADLMLAAAKEVEESICRIAQMGRAAGVHLVIATQSPRADVITGLMKANIPSRIALKVSSALESRIILDAGGNAEKLVGNGDMLYAPIGTTKPVRVQGSWVSDEERESILSFIKLSGEAEYNEEIITQMEKATEDKQQEKPDEEASEKKDYDELLPQAVDVILESGQASVSLLQRRLKLGYSRAARIVDQMEEMGVVGPFEGSKPRQILVTKTQWQEMQLVQGTAPLETPDSDSMPDMDSADDLF